MRVHHKHWTAYNSIKNNNSKVAHLFDLAPTSLQLEGLGPTEESSVQPKDTY